MKSQSSGLFERFNRLKYPQKFTLISLLFIVPLLAFIPVIIEQVTRAQQYGYYELYGTYYLQPLQDLLEHVQEHNRLTLDESQGLATPEQITAVREKIGQDFAQLDEYHALYADELRLTSELSELKAQWNSLIENASSLTDTQITAAHTQIENSILNLIRYVGDTSFLILDPELDTYYLMDTILLRLPQSQITLNQIRNISVNVVRNSSLTINNQTLLLVLTRELNEDLSALQTSIATSIQNNKTGQIAPSIRTPLQNYIEATNEFLSYVGSFNQGAQPTNADLSQLTLLADQAQAAHAQFYDVVSEIMISGINNRIARYSSIAYLPGSVGIVSVLVGLWVGIAIMRRISQPLSELAIATNEMASGHLSTRVNIRMNDEVGQVGLAFNHMAQALETSQTRLAKSAEISRQLSAIIDPDQLVLEVVERIKTAFNYYHVHIYLLQEDGQTLKMVGGSGETGKILLANEHAISIEQGIVGRAARTRQPIFVPDTQADPQWLPNPLLPETRSEIAAPITFGQTMLGVLDIQHNLLNVLTEADVELMQTIANQVAIALQNAYTLKTSLDNTEKLRVSQQLFQTILETAPVPFLISSVIDGKVLYANEQLGLLLGISVSDLIGRQTPNFYYDPADRATLIDKVRKEGSVKNHEIHVKKVDGTPFWVSASLQPIRYEDTPALLAAFYDLTDRKTYEERLAQRSERDRFLNRISNKIRSATSMEQILQIAAQEVRQYLNAPRTAIELLPEEFTQQN